MHMGIKRVVICVGLMVAVACLGSCADATNLFNSEFLDAVNTSITGESSVATLPGGAPAILLAVENSTSKNVLVEISYRTGTNEVETMTATIEPGQRSAQAVACPVTEITVGSLMDTTASGAAVLLGDGGEDDPRIIVEPFGVILQEGANYDCGDGITFTVVASSQTASGYRVFAFVERAD
ncbi:MAG: hypothetical protein JXO22_12000 [Phycisphaerae bacterium]|nr:hypothetical protein [Phycisphaerae bacterium]